MRWPVLNREQILGAKDRAQQTITIPEWGGDVLITALSVRDRSVVLGEWARLGNVQKEGGDTVGAMLDIKLRLVALSITDADGVPVFSADDVVALATKSSEAIGVISDAAITLNKFFVSATEDAAKN
jgi:hypothetical protein